MRSDGDDWILNGEKMWISLGNTADHFLFFCWTDQEKQKARDHSGNELFHHRAFDARLFERNAPRQDGHPCRRYRIFLAPGRTRP
jgi:alkylation response protein AidB-like acyl-CoA dehydrogenase